MCAPLNTIGETLVFAVTQTWENYNSVMPRGRQVGALGLLYSLHLRSEKRCFLFLPSDGHPR